MKQARILLLALSSLFLVACGNQDDGAMAALKKQSSGAVSTAASITYGPSGSMQFGPCKTLAVYGGNNPSYASLYSNTQACASTSNANIVKLKTTAQFPALEEFCLVPMNSLYSYTESCFSTTGQVDITMSTDQFTAVSLVRKSDLSAYKAYLTGTSSVYPAMAYAQLR